jgi:DNA repair protein RecO (recombination protein O)
MQFIQTPAIILQKIPINDFKFIIKLFSEKKGLISASVEINNFIQPALFQPPNITNIQIIQNKNNKYSIKDIAPIYIYKELYLDFKKNTIAQFITEILIKSIKEELTDEKLFQLSKQTFINLDKYVYQNINYVHLEFIKNYLLISGHYPINNYDTYNQYFNPSEGRFVHSQNISTLSKDDSLLIYQFFFTDNENTSSIPVLHLTHILLNYLQLHLSIPSIQSLTMLKEALLEFEL